MSKLVQFPCIHERALNKHTLYLTVMKMSLLTLGDWRRVVRTEVDQTLVYWRNQPTKLETKISTCLRIDRQTEILHFAHFLNRFCYFLCLSFLIFQLRLTYRYVFIFLLFSMDALPSEFSQIFTNFKNSQNFHKFLQNSENSFQFHNSKIPLPTSNVAMTISKSLHFLFVCLFVIFGCCCRFVYVFTRFLPYYIPTSN